MLCTLPDPKFRELGSFPACFWGMRAAWHAWEWEDGAEPGSQAPGQHSRLARRSGAGLDAGSRDGRRIPPGLGRALENQQRCCCCCWGRGSSGGASGSDGGSDPVSAL